VSESGDSVKVIDTLRSTLSAPMSLALLHGSSFVEGLVLPKFVETGDLSLNNLVIWWISAHGIGGVIGESKTFPHP
jgi:hypothetical protein